MPNLLWMDYVIWDGIHVSDILEDFLIFQVLIIGEHLKNFWIIFVYDFNHFKKVSCLIWYVWIGIERPKAIETQLVARFFFFVIFPRVYVEKIDTKICISYGAVERYFYVFYLANIRQIVSVKYVPIFLDKLFLTI